MLRSQNSFRLFRLYYNVNTNRISTVFGNEDAVKLVKEAIMRDKVEPSVLYIDKEKSQSLIGRASEQWLVSPNHNGIIHTIAEIPDLVKPEFSSQTKTRQFKRWFGKIEDSPSAAGAFAEGNKKLEYFPVDSCILVEGLL